MSTIVLDAAALSALPTPVGRWLEGTWTTGIDDVETLALVGRARIRRGGTGPRLPARFRMTHLLGVHHVADIRVGIGPVTLVHALDAYVDGHGVTSVGHELDAGPELDQGAFLFQWCEAFLYPSAWQRLRGLRWEPVNDGAAVLVLPFERRVERALVHFDAATGQPSSFEATRWKGRARTVPWRVEYADWGWTNGVPVPHRGTVSWSDEPAPWFVFTIEEAIPDVPVTDEIHRARNLLAAAMGTAPG